MQLSEETLELLASLGDGAADLALWYLHGTATCAFTRKGKLWTGHLPG